MSRTEQIKELREELNDIISRLEDELDSAKLTVAETDHWQEIAYNLTQALTETDYLVASMDARDEQELYDEDGNPEDESSDRDGSIW